MDQFTRLSQVVRKWKRAEYGYSDLTFKVDQKGKKRKKKQESCRWGNFSNPNAHRCANFFFPLAKIYSLLEPTQPLEAGWNRWAAPSERLFY